MKFKSGGVDLAEASRLMALMKKQGLARQVVRPMTDREVNRFVTWGLMPLDVEMQEKQKTEIETRAWR